MSARPLIKLANRWKQRDAKLWGLRCYCTKPARPPETLHPYVILQREEKESKNMNKKKIVKSVAAVGVAIGGASIFQDGEIAYAYASELEQTEQENQDEVVIDLDEVSDDTSETVESSEEPVPDTPSESDDAVDSTESDTKAT